MEEIKVKKPSVTRNLKYDLPAGLVVFLVALPLCLGISIASGAAPIAGILTGIVGGIVVGFFSGSKLGVSGPEAGLAAIILGYLTTTGVTYEMFLLGVVLTGIFQILFGYIKAGVLADYFPSSVIKGMLAAIGILLVLKQIPHGLGDDKDPEGDVTFFQADGENTFSEIINAIANPHLGAVIITVISLAIVILWQTKALKKITFLSAIPAPLLVVVIGIALNQAFTNFYPTLALKNIHLVNIPVYESVGEFFTSFRTPDFSRLWEYDQQHFESLFQQYKLIIGMGFTLAVVASLETLLSVEATDKLDPEKRVTPTNKELIAQGIGNTVVGLIGGIPMTQAIVRSSVNINSGGKTKTATIFHGILLFLFVLLVPDLLNKIPLACMAGILIMIGYNLANVTLFKGMFKLGMRQFLPFIITIISILLTDLLIGIIIGLIVAIFYILKDNRNKEPFDVKVKRMKDGPYKYKVLFTLNEEVTYLSKHILLLSLHDVPMNSKIIIDASEARFVSHDVVEGINEFMKYAAPTKNIEVEYIKRELVQYEVDDSVLDAATKN